jgi:tRNA (mo5U34)-methyltransferase
MFELDAIKLLMKDTRLEPWVESIDTDLASVLDERMHGDEERWKNALQQLPAINADHIDMLDGVIRISANSPLSEADRNNLQTHLESFIPWRKGPFEIHGVYIDTEWRSDWKWQRVSPHISPLQDRNVLDVGCGSGYHGWRMAEAGARFVLGIDPGRLFYYQYRVLKHFLKPHDYPFFMLPFGIQHMPENLKGFDTVFSMGILYHRKSPIDHLQELKNLLRDGGELVLETLVIEGQEGMTLLPADRYGKMRNVWFIPSVPTLIGWMKRVGYQHVRLVDENVTSLEEQRSTNWMRFESLKDFLDPDDQSKTVEGYPAPRRAVIIAEA